MDSAAGSCNACGAAGTALMKLSLGKDFFGRAYDRLSPSTDQSPKWYCEGCSMQKNLQRDFRDILGGIRQTDGRPKLYPVNPEEFQRASFRLREIAAHPRGTQPLAVPHSVRCGTTDGALPDHHHASLTNTGSLLPPFKRHIFVCLNQRPKTIRAAAAPTGDRKSSTPISRAKRNV